jgi:uncharacterized membrane protein YkoI
MNIKNMISVMLVLATIVAGFSLTSRADENGTQAKLEAKAKITKAAAQETALAKVPHGTVKESELEEEDGKLIWSFDIATPDSKDITEVAVDAITGKIISIEKETPEQQAKEKADDEKKAAKKEKN